MDTYGSSTFLHAAFLPALALVKKRLSKPLLEAAPERELLRRSLHRSPSLGELGRTPPSW